MHMVAGMSPSKTKRTGRAPRQQLKISETDDGLATSLEEATARRGTQRGLSASTRGQGAQANSRPNKAAGRPNTAAFSQRGSHTARSGSRAGAQGGKGNALLFSSDCLSLQVSQAHTLIKSFPNQEIILHDPDRVMQQKCKKLGAEQMETSCKLLDFDVHLSKRTRKGRRGETGTAGAGREFINVDELIQAQINEGCHGLDAFTSSSRGPLLAHGASAKSPTTNCQSATSLAAGMNTHTHNTLLKESLLGK